MLPLLRRIKRTCGDDRGSASLQLTVVVPSLLLLALVVVQFALAWHAQHIAQYAAQDALAATRVEDGTVADGRARARGELASLAHRILNRPAVTVQRTAARASVRVDGTAMTVVPGLHLHVAGHASGAVERLTTPTEGRA